MSTISKSYSFDAAHQIVGHKGKCARPHGHTYEVIVSLRGYIKRNVPAESDYGMVMDYYDLDQVMKPIIEDYFDHFDLNKTLTEIPRTTAELIACAIFGMLWSSLEHMLPLIQVESVTVKETPKTAATATWEDWDSVGRPYATFSGKHQDPRGALKSHVQLPTSEGSSVEGGVQDTTEPAQPDTKAVGSGTYTVGHQAPARVETTAERPHSTVGRQRD